MSDCRTCPNAIKRVFAGETKESVVSCIMYPPDDVNGSTVVRDVMNGETWMCPLDTTVMDRIFNQTKKEA